MNSCVGLLTKRGAGFSLILRRLNWLVIAGIVGAICSSGVWAADVERGATRQKNSRRHGSPENSQSAGKPLFSPIPTGSSFAITNPIIMITPARLDFGFVAPGKSATNTFMLENVGVGRLSGVASVRRPFKIDSGGKYILRVNEIQIVTVVYSPKRARVDKAPVTFTAGGTSLQATVIGRSLRSKDQLQPVSKP